MFNLLLDGATGTGGTSIVSLVMVGVLVLLMIVYLVFGTMNRRKQQEQAMKMLNDLKVGDKVVTNAGIYGEIVSQKETDMGRVVILKTGCDEDGNHPSYITVNASVILGIDIKKDLILDAEGNVIVPEDLKDEVLKSASETEVEVPTAEPPEEEPDMAEKSRKKLAARRKHVATENND